MSDGVYLPKRGTLFDEERATDGLNLAPAKASTLREVEDALNYVASRYRPLFSFWGGFDIVNGPNLIRQLWLNSSPGCPGVAARMLIVPEDTPTPIDGQGTSWIVDRQAGGSGNAEAAGTSLIPPTSDQAGTTTYPASCRSVQAIDAHTSYQDDGLYEIALGSATNSGPRLKSGVIFEKPNLTPQLRHIKDGGGALTSVQYQGIPTDWMVAGSPIIGPAFETKDVRALSIARDFFRAVYKRRRLAFGWSTINPGTNGIVMSTAPTEYQYVFDQSIGQHVATSFAVPTATGPGINIPLRYTASGRNTTVRIYVAVYASMSASSQNGGLAVYNLDSSGAIQGPTALTNGPTITGTSYAWYPSGADFNEATAPYFSAQAHPNRRYDHVVLCAKRTSGASASVRIGAIRMWAHHATS